MVYNGPMQGRFLVFEGPDGAGKSSQLERLAQRVEDLGREVVRLVDVMPTILEWVGADVPQEIDGRSLLGLMKEEGFASRDVDRAAYIESHALDYQYGWSKLFGVVGGDWKYIEAPRPELAYTMRPWPCY